jgi:hypothetical protein
VLSVFRHGPGNRTRPPRKALRKRRR